MGALWAPKSEGVGLIVRAISFRDFQHMWSWSTNVTDRRTDRRTDDMRSQDRALHYSASRGKKLVIKFVEWLNCLFLTISNFNKPHVVGRLDLMLLECLSKNSWCDSYIELYYMSLNVEFVDVSNIELVACLMLLLAWCYMPGSSFISFVREKNLDYIRLVT